MKKKISITNKVSELRKAAGITQKELAKHLGVSLATIQNWEAEKTDMTGYSLVMLCDYFDVSPNEIYGSGDRPHDWGEKAELLGIFLKLSSDGKRALLACARGIDVEYDGDEDDLLNEDRYQAEIADCCR